MKIFGIPFKVDLTFWFIAAALGLGRMSDPTAMIEWIAVVFVSITIHEFGHALLGKSFGLQPRIQLYGMGGATSWSTGRDVTPLRSILISLAGPFADFVFATIILAIWIFLPSETRSNPFMKQTFIDLMWVNFGWGIFNLLPMLPLDGGHVIAGLEQMITKRRDLRATIAISIGAAVTLCVAALLLRDMWIGLLAVIFLISNVSTLVQMRSLTAAQNQQRPLDGAWNSLSKGNVRASIQAAKRAIDSSTSNSERREAMELLVRAYLQAGEFQEARTELNKLEMVFGFDPCLEAFFLLQTGEAGKALELLQDYFSRDKSPRVGNMLAHALMATGKFEEAIELAGDPALEQFAGAIYRAIQSTAYSSGSYEPSALAGSMAFRLERDPVVAYKVATALGRLDRIDEAVQWVRAAVDAGLPDVSLLPLDPDMAPLKDNPEFEDIVKSVPQQR